MGVEIIKREYNNFYNGSTTNWLIGNVGDWQECIINIDSEIRFQASNQKPLEIDYLENRFILSSGESWGALGFDTGMTITFSFDVSIDTDEDGIPDVTATVVNDYTIVNVLNDKLKVAENIQGNDYDTMPTNIGNEKISNAFIISNKLIEGASFSYGHIPNNSNDTNNLRSLIDNTTTSFVLPDINTVPVGEYQIMQPIGKQSGMSVRKCEIRKVDGFTNENESIGNYTIEPLTFRLQPQNAGSGDSDDRDIKVIPMTRPVSTGDPYQTVNQPYQVPLTSQGDVLGASQQFCFYYDSSINTSVDILGDFSFKIINTNENSNIDNFSIVLLRFSGGSNLIYAEKEYLQTWLDGRSFLGKSINFNKIHTLNVNVGDSYVLAFEYEHNNGDDYYIDIQMSPNGIMPVSKFNGSFTSSGKQFFQIKVGYMLSTLFESINSFNPNDIPVFLEGKDSLTDNFDVKLFPVWNNPNVLLKNDLSQTKRLGNTGWFNENFNELRNSFNVESIEYFDIDSNKITSLGLNSRSSIKVVISGVENLGSSTLCNFGFCWIPENEEDYKNKETPFYQNVYLQSGGLFRSYPLDNVSFPQTGAGINGASLDSENIKFTNEGGNLVFTADFIPNNNFITEFKNKEETDRNYIIWVSVSDGQLETNFSNRVSLLADFNQLTKIIPPSAPYPYIKNSFLEHQNDENSIGVDNLQGIVQDDVLCRLPFMIKNDNSIVFNSFSFGVEAYNNSLNKTFELERYPVDTSSYQTDINGVQQINFNSNRGFKLGLDNNKNWVKINRDNDLDSNDFNAYIAYFGFKIRYEDWIKNENSPVDFLDLTQNNEGLHNDWVHYLRSNGWEINFFTEIEATENNEPILYRNKWGYQFNDYDENTNISTTHEYFRDSDDTLINVGTDPITGKTLGAILNNEPTRIEISFEILDGGLWNISNSYSVTTIEVDNGTGQFDMRQLSSIWDPEDDNPLKPVQGFNKLKIEVDGTNKILKSTCIVEPDLLQKGARYRITGRVGCGDSGIVFETGLYEPLYEDLYE